MLQNREQALEEVVRCAIRMRKRMIDLDDVVVNFLAPKSEVAKFDALIERLTSESQDQPATN